MKRVDDPLPTTSWSPRVIGIVVIAVVLIAAWVITGHTGRSVKLLPVPNRALLRQSIAVASPSTVKIKESGCGVTTAGSGVVVAPHLVLTAAHVLAGTTDSIVVDAAGAQRAIPIVVDPLSDLAVLYVDALNDHPLQINLDPPKRGTVGVVLGYPHAGSRDASPAVVLDNYRAEGHDIYGNKRIVRQILEVEAPIFPGSSGGPLVDRDGTLIGMVFGQSQDRSDIGYALTSAAIREVVDKGLDLTSDGLTAVSTGACLPPAG